VAVHAQPTAHFLRDPGAHVGLTRWFHAVHAVWVGVVDEVRHVGCPARRAIAFMWRPHARVGGHGLPSGTATARPRAMRVIYIALMS